MNSSNDKKWAVLSTEELTNETIDTLVINTDFTKEELCDFRELSIKDYFYKKLTETKNTLNIALPHLKDGGILFIYGYPQYLSELAVWLNDLSIDNSHMLFKYWIGMEFKADTNSQSLPQSHLGLLMYLKTRSLKQPTPFKLNTKNVLIPHQHCPACGLNVKDWGGKKHLLNPLGTAISDVWHDFTFEDKITPIIPEKCLIRIYNLRKNENNSNMVVIYEKSNVPVDISNETQNDNLNNLQHELTDSVITADSIEYMHSLSKLYPEGLFDMVFADPPYNLSKNYNVYQDGMSEKEYIKWCDEWLNCMCDVVKPGGALLVLNIPKWAIYHAKTLNKRMILRNWIIWDALSTPSGKILPAHYSLLYYTKPGKNPTLNYNSIKEIDSREYCLRNSCIEKRKRNGIDNKEYVSDIWHDIFRIKHKKDRDNHPCQLPIKLMCRIIKYTTNENDWVYDPFGGAGTTAIGAKICGRHYVISDIDPMYKEIAEQNILNVHMQQNGEMVLKRNSIHVEKNIVSKNKIEKEYYMVSESIGYAPSLNELNNLNIELSNNINKYYHDFKYLKKITKRMLENKNLKLYQ